MNDLINGAVTLLVGLVAFGVYWWQKKDHKKDAANIILLEIQNAERVLGRIKEAVARGSLPNDFRFMPTENWGKYKYLFVRDFDRDEWDHLTEFYSKCLLVDETIKYNAMPFWNDVEQIRVNKQRILADYAKEMTDKLGTATTNAEMIAQEFNDITMKFDTMYMSRQGYFGYTPQKTLDDARIYINSMNLTLSQQAVGTKLKKLAKI